MKTASGIGEGRDLAEAVAAAGQAVSAGLGGAPADWVIAFVSHAFQKDFSRLHDLLAATLPFRSLLGCSASGVIGGGHELEGRSAVSLWAASLPGVKILTFHARDADLPDLDVGPSPWRALVGTGADGDPPIVVLADPFSIRVGDLLAGFDFAYPRSVKIGGLSSGAKRAGESALWAGSGFYRAGAVGAALAGPVEMDALVAQGCRPVGQVLRVTGAEKNLLLSLNGEPALRMLEQTIVGLTERDRVLAQKSLFLGILTDEFREEPPGPGDFLVRSLIGVDPNRGIIAVGEALNPGQTVQFHVRDPASSREDLESALARYSKSEQAGNASGALLFSCLGRGQGLYGEPDHDTGRFREVLGEIPVGGFFGNGEIGPLGGATRLHGFTSVFGVLREMQPREEPSE
ncbi:MAG: FIST N-terminal domain-containing protein [Planctomycetota bacterium]